jgi:hypothetical protein
MVWFGRAWVGMPSAAAPALEWSATGPEMIVSPASLLT